MCGLLCGMRRHPSVDAMECEWKTPLIETDFIVKRKLAAALQDARAKHAAPNASVRGAD